MVRQGLRSRLHQTVLRMGSPGAGMKTDRRPQRCIGKTVFATVPLVDGIGMELFTKNANIRTTSLTGLGSCGIIPTRSTAAFSTKTVGSTASAFGTTTTARRKKSRSGLLGYLMVCLDLGTRTASRFLRAVTNMASRSELGASTIETEMKSE